MVNGWLPVFVMVTLFGEDERPINTTEKDRLVGLNETLGPGRTCRRIDTLLAAPFATAKSTAPSLLKSPTAANRGREPTGISLLGWNVPSPLPRKIEIELVV